MFLSVLKIFEWRKEIDRLYYESPWFVASFSHWGVLIHLSTRTIVLNCHLAFHISESRGESERDRTLAASNDQSGKGQTRDNRRSATPDRRTSTNCQLLEDPPLVGILSDQTRVETDENKEIS